MSLSNYTLTVSQPGYLPITSNILENFCIDDAVNALTDELWYTAEAQGASFDNSIPAREDAIKQLREHGDAVIEFGGYIHELTLAEN